MLSKTMRVAVVSLLCTLVLCAVFIYMRRPCQHANSTVPTNTDTNMPTAITSTKHHDEIIQTATSTQALLFYAQWCPRCPAVKEIFAQVTREIDCTDRALLVDIDLLPELVHAYEITSVPQVVLVESPTQTKAKPTQLTRGTHRAKLLSQSVDESGRPEFELPLRRALSGHDEVQE